MKERKRRQEVREEGRKEGRKEGREKGRATSSSFFVLQVSASRISSLFFPAGLLFPHRILRRRYDNFFRTCVFCQASGNCIERREGECDRHCLLYFCFVDISSVSLSSVCLCFSCDFTMKSWQLMNCADTCNTCLYYCRW